MSMTSCGTPLTGVGLGEGDAVTVGVGVAVGVLVGSMVGVAVTEGAGVGVTVGNGDGVAGLRLTLGDGTALFDGVTSGALSQPSDTVRTRLMAAATATCHDLWVIDERHMVTLPGIARVQSLNTPMRRRQSRDAHYVLDAYRTHQPIGSIAQSEWPASANLCA
jgi:hypothetical protein